MTAIGKSSENKMTTIGKSIPSENKMTLGEYYRRQAILSGINKCCRRRSGVSAIRKPLK